MGPVLKVRAAALPPWSGWISGRSSNRPSQPPNNQSRLSIRRVALDPIDGLSGQARFPSNLSDAHRFLPQHGAHLDELVARGARLAADVGAVATLLGVLDTGPLCGLVSLSPCLRGRGHEGDQRIADCLLHRVSGRSIEGEVVDHRADNDASPHELADGVAYVLIIAAQAINPTDHEHIAGPQLVEEAATLGALDKAAVETGHPVVGDHFVDGEARGLGVTELVLDGLLCCGYASILDRRHDVALL